MKSILTIEDICFKYGTQLVLEEVHLTVREGDFIGIVGKNGSGKTTFLKLLLGLIKPICGYIKFKNKIKISYVEQLTINSFISFPTNVYETIMLGLYKNIGFLRFPNEGHKNSILETLKLVGLEGYEKKQISMLSGGEQQRVMIAKALVSSPDLLILDEPTAGIDAQSEKNFIDLLRKLNKQLNKTIIMVSHDIFALSECNRIYEITDKTIKERIKNV
jgi:zinc transport system ATP-binding protein